MKAYFRARCQTTREAFVPLHHPPGHAQVDFGEATVEVGGRRGKIAFFCLILPHSDVWFVNAYPRETTEAFLDGHVGAFAFLGGVPRSILYDNTTLAAVVSGPERAGSEPAAGTAQAGAGSPTPLRIPYGNKEVAFGMGARYGAEGWYAPPGVDLDAFRERGWL